MSSGRFCMWLDPLESAAGKRQGERGPGLTQERSGSQPADE